MHNIITCIDKSIFVYIATPYMVITLKNIKINMHACDQDQNDDMHAWLFQQCMLRTCMHACE